ncbi:MAG: 50S ribosomal protein L10 [Saprospiraceae bacterium]|nr:50S ribosomal protein L10 [Saprospiraceae bacterium]
MTREEKSAAIAELKEELGSTPFFYLTDSSTLSVGKVNALRRLCYEQGVKMKVAKNTLIQKALEDAPAEKGYAALFEVLHGPTTIMIAENPKAPALLIEKFRKTNERPLLKAAYIDTAVYIGDEQLEPLTKLKSKDEMVGEIIGLLQSPGRRLASQLKATGSKIAGIVKTLEEREG